MKSAWDRSTLQYLSFGLSGEQPLQLSFATHASAADTLRDMHWELELGVVREGSMEREYEDFRADLDAGDIWLCGPWEPHGYRITRPPCRCAVFVISPAWVARLGFDNEGLDWLAPFCARPALRPRLPRGAGPGVLAAVDRLQTLADTHATHAVAHNRLALQQILLTLCDGWLPPQPVGRVSSASLDLIGPGLRLVLAEKRYVPLNEAAAHCGLGRNAFSRHFRAAMGIDFAEFGLRCRLRGAARELLDAGRPVKAIASEWGFADQSHLHRSFVRHYHCTPGQYRSRAFSGGLPF